MKKIFTFFTLFILSMSMAMQAQLLSAINDTPEGETLFTDEVQVSGRHNAPQAIYTNHFDWKDVAPSAGHGTRYTFLGPKYYSSYYGQYTRDMFYTKTIMIADGYKANNNSINTAKPAITLYLTYSASNGLMDYGAETLPSQATYTVQTSSYSAALCNIVDYGSLSASNECASKNMWGNCVQWNYYNCFQDDNGNLLYGNNTPNSKIFATSVTAGGANFTSGSLTFTAGRHGYPYVYSTNLTSGSNTYNVTIGDSRHLTTTYTSCRVATDEENGKAVLQAYDGTNTLTLVFNITTADANIGIPAKQYTVGTDVWGGCTDNDGYTRWMFKSGKITISKSSNNLSMTTASLKGTSSGGDFDMNLTISSKTPNKTFTAVNLSEGKISGYDDTNYSPFLVSSSQSNDKINIYMPFTQASNFTSSQKFAAFFGPDQNGDYASSSYITKNGTKYVMSQGVAVVNYDKTYQVAELTSAYLNSGTFYYIHTITSQVNNSSSWNKFYFSGERNEAFSATFDAATPADHDAEKAHFSVNNGSQSMYLTFYTDDTKDGVVPSGTYDVRATKKDNTVYVGTYSSGLLDSRGQQSSYWWLLRFGTVEVFNLNETYYITQGTTLLSARDNNMTFTIGTAPKDVTLTTPAANGTAQIQFTATNWNNKVIDYASGTAHKFFQGQTISLQATPASGYQVAYWTLGGVKIDGSELQDTYSYTVGSGATQTLAAVFEQVSTNFHLAWDAGDGELVDNAVYSYAVEGDYPGGEELPDGAPQATREGYQLTGWYDAEHDLTWTDDDWTMPNHDVTYVAQWAANTFTVRFNANGGGSSMNNQNFTYGTSQNLTANAFTAPTGKHFAGWATSEANATAGTVAYANSARGDQITTGNGVTVDLWAVWAVNTYSVTIVSNNTDYGTVDVAEVATVPYGTVISTSTNTIDVNGTTVTATETTDGAQYTYDFTGWTNGTATVTENLTVTANFTRTLNTYTVTVAKNENAYGTLSEESDNTVTVASVPYGTVISTSTNTVTINGTTVTATKAENTAQYTYAFANWTNGTATVTGNTTVTANFTRTLNTYTVTIVSNNTDYGTVDEDEVASVPYGTTITTDANTIDVNGTTVTATKATDDASYTYAFDGWTNGTATVTGDLTVTATFTATPNITEFNLEDSYASGDSYYTTYNTLIGRTIDITYKRSFTAGRWATFSLPFGYSFQTHSEDNPFKDQVFELISVDYAAGGRMVINCVKNSTGIVANKPYILIPTSDIDNPTFVGVTPVAIAAGSKTVNNTKDDVYTVEFISTAYKQVMPTGKRTIYISGNRLYYANVDTDIPAFRCYFNLLGGVNDDDVLHVQPRLMVAAPDGEIIEQAEEETVETRKYIENGILVIERNGIKYDAQGHIIK